MKILLNAVPFGYGPVSKIFCIGKMLKNQGHDILFCGSGIAYEFMKREEICEVKYIDVYTSEGCENLKQISLEFDYALTSMEPLFVENVSNLIKVGFVDSLGWLWDDNYFEKYPKLREVTHYFVQNTFNVKEEINRFNIKNVCFVEGIIEYVDKREKIDNNLVINFGGVENIFTENEKLIYPKKMIEVISKIPEILFNFDKIIITASRKIIDDLKILYPKFPGIFISLDHNTFLGELKNARMLITTPGLTTLLEAYQIGIECLFLPPQNYSQYLILKGITKSGYPRDLMNLDLFFKDLHIDKSNTEEEAVNLINYCIKEMFNSEELSNELKNAIYKGFNEIDLNGQIQSFQDGFIKKVGVNGISEICHRIWEIS